MDCETSTSLESEQGLALKTDTCGRSPLYRVMQNALYTQITFGVTSTIIPAKREVFGSVFKIV